MNRHHSSWLWCYLTAVTLRAAAAERDADLTRFVFSHRAHLYMQLLWGGGGLQARSDSKTIIDLHFIPN